MLPGQSSRLYISPSTLSGRLRLCCPILYLYFKGASEMRRRATIARTLASAMSHNTHVPRALEVKQSPTQGDRARKSRSRCAVVIRACRCRHDTPNGSDPSFARATTPKEGRRINEHRAARESSGWFIRKASRGAMAIKLTTWSPPSQAPPLRRAKGTRPVHHVDFFSFSTTKFRHTRTLRSGSGHARSGLHYRYDDNGFDS